MKHRSAGVSPASFGTVPVPGRAVYTVNKRSESSLTQKAWQALIEAIAKVLEDHPRRGIPLVVWRNGRMNTFGKAMTIQSWPGFSASRHVFRELAEAIVRK
jgi:hypothetical protein